MYLVLQPMHILRIVSARTRWCKRRMCRAVKRSGRAAWICFQMTVLDLLQDLQALVLWH